MIATENPQAIEIPHSIRNCIEVLDQKKAEDIRLLHVGDISSVTDYFVIVTGTSNPHLKALGGAAEEALQKQGIRTVTCGSGDQSGWVIVDAYDFMIHIFTEETRRFYNLEALWKDAGRIAV